MDLISLIQGPSPLTKSTTVIRLSRTSVSNLGKMNLVLEMLLATNRALYYSSSNTICSLTILILVEVATWIFSTDDLMDFSQQDTQLSIYFWIWTTYIHPSETMLGLGHPSIQTLKKSLYCAHLHCTAHLPYSASIALPSFPTLPSPRCPPTLRHPPTAAAPKLHRASEPPWWIL